MPRNLQASLVIAQLVAGLTLIRSVAYDRWITVGVALVLLLGLAAAKRERTWGLGLAFAAACSLLGAFLLGFASPAFVIVAALGALPFVLALPAMRRFDQGAATLFTLLAGSLGIAGALVWRPLALALVDAFPSLTPSVTAQHGAFVAASSVALLVIGRSLLRSLPPSQTPSHIRVSTSVSPQRVHVEREELEDEETNERTSDRVARS